MAKRKIRKPPTASPARPEPARPEPARPEREPQPQPLELGLPVGRPAGPDPAAQGERPSRVVVLDLAG